jgi:hypothetical protein
MSVRFHALVLALSFTGEGYDPARIPAHQLDRETGKIRSTSGSRRK